MKAMARQRSHSIEFKRQVAQEFLAGESLYALSKRHDISRQLIRVWVERYEAGALDEDTQAADLLQEYEAKIAALERMVGRQALETEFLKGALKNAARPRSEINLGSAGIGSGSHLAGELLKMRAGIDMVHVPFRGAGPALTGVLGAQLEVILASAPSSIALIRSGKLRGLAVTSTMRLEALRDLPTVGEFVPGYEVNVWFGMGAPKGTSADVIDKLNKEINAGLADPTIKA